jgi:hypothetical protein
MIDLTQIPVQAAIVGTGITALNVIILTVIGWFVTRHIATLTRDSTEAIAKLSRDLTEQQIAVALAQVDINRQTQAMSLLKERTGLKEELLKAIDARENEIATKTDPVAFYVPEALHALWRLENQTRVLFGTDVMDIIRVIHAELKLKEGYLLEIRGPNVNYDKGLHDKVTESSFKLVDLRAELGNTINRYSSMGHIRMLDELPSKSGLPAL